MSDVVVPNLGLHQIPSVMIVEIHNRTETCCPQGEKEYRIQREDGQRLLTAKEELDCCCRECRCCFRRDFDIDIQQGESGAKVFKLTHHLLCCSYLTCCCSCCRHRLTARTADGKEVGSVKSDCETCCSCFPAFSVYDHKGVNSYTVKKNIGCFARMCGGCSCCCCVAAIPNGLSISGKGEGKLEHITSQGRKEDVYRLHFPSGASEVERLLLIGATLLVDYTLYDHQNRVEKKPTDQQMQ